MLEGFVWVVSSNGVGNVHWVKVFFSPDGHGHLCNARREFAECATAFPPVFDVEGGEYGFFEVSFVFLEVGYVSRCNDQLNLVFVFAAQQAVNFNMFGVGCPVSGVFTAKVFLGRSFIRAQCWIL